MKEIEVAVNWWANELSASGLLKHDNGDKSMSMFANFVSSLKKKPVPKEIEVFKESLTKQLMERVNDADVRLPMMWLGVDYAPDKYLGEAAVKAGIDCMLFPFKTSMHIESGKVTVSKGYSSPSQVLYLNNQTIHSHPLHDALYNLRCPVCDSKIAFEADLDADGTNWYAKCCEKRFILSTEYVKVVVEDLEEYEMDE